MLHFKNNVSYFINNFLIEKYKLDNPTTLNLKNVKIYISLCCFYFPFVSLELFFFGFTKTD